MKNQKTDDAIQSKTMFAMVLLAVLGNPGYDVAASELDLNISNKSINLQFNTEPPFSVANNSKFEVGAGYIYREGGTKIANLDFHALGQTVLVNMPTTVLIGARAIYFDEDEGDGGGLALGGGAHVKIPQVPGMGVKATGHIAPQITSFGEAERILRTDIRATYRVIQNADIYAGYRAIRARLEDSGSQSVDENIHIGFMLIF